MRAFSYHSGDRLRLFSVGLLVGFQKQGADKDVTTYVGGPSDAGELARIVIASLTWSVPAVYG